MGRLAVVIDIKRMSHSDEFDTLDAENGMLSGRR